MNSWQLNGILIAIIKQQSKLSFPLCLPLCSDSSYSNAYHTLFVARLAYETTEKKLRREFEQFGPIKNIQMVLDNDGKPRGYAFVEFEREEDMTSAYKRADGRKIDGRRIIVDVERGRLASSLSVPFLLFLS
jgi:RNA recognition motif-containing protein